MARPLRYTFILVLAALGTTLAAVGGWRYARASAPVPGPIILISIDTLRADHLPAYGYSRIKTPAIDMLARDGIVFEHAYSHSPQTLPAHAALLTGRLPFETGVRDDDVGLFKPNERLLSQMLRDRGYTTGAVVSSGLLRRATGMAQGFDFFDDPSALRQAQSDETPRDDDAGAAGGELTDAQRQRDGAESEAIAERWLDSAGTTRLFLFLHLNEPHAPARPPKGAAPTYDSQIERADEILGRFIQYLKTHQLYDVSTIVLVSDHGEGLGDHGEREHGLFVYDEAIHVPLILKQAAGLGAGRRVAAVVQHADVVPTLLDLAKAPIPGNLRGRSLKAVTDGTATLPEAVVYSETRYGRHRFGWSELVSIRNQRFQYIRAPREELYDLDRDPREVESADAVPGPTEKARASLRNALARILGQELPAEDGDAIDPKDKLETVAAYRQGLALVADRQWLKAIEVFQKLARDESTSADVWRQLARAAELAERHDLALAAYQRVAELTPSEPAPLVEAARISLTIRRLDDAEKLATRAVEAAGPKTPPAEQRGPAEQREALASAHEVLAGVALARRDADQAREEALAARRADPSSLLPLYVDARLLYDEGDYLGALARLEKATSAISKGQSAPLQGLHLLMAEALIWADRPAEAEVQLLDELRAFPHNLLARSALAMLYHAGGEQEKAGQVAADLVRVTPSPESYAMAAKLWTSIGDRQQAALARADARRLFSNPKAAH